MAKGNETYAFTVMKKQAIFVHSCFCTVFEAVA